MPFPARMGTTSMESSFCSSDRPVTARPSLHERGRLLDPRHVPRLVHASPPVERGMRQRLSAVPIAARSRSSSVAAPAISSSAHRLSTAFERISSSSIRRWVPSEEGIGRMLAVGGDSRDLCLAARSDLLELDRHVTVRVEGEVEVLPQSDLRPIRPLRHNHVVVRVDLHEHVAVPHAPDVLRIA